MGRFNN
jgi:centrosomal protein CEP76